MKLSAIPHCTVHKIVLFIISVKEM